METNIIYHEDCLDGMKRIPDGSVDLVLTDPPYLFIKGGQTNPKVAGKLKKGSFVTEQMGDFGEPQINALCETLIPKFSHKYNAYFFCSEMQIVYYLNFAVSHKLRYNVLVWDRQVKTLISKQFFRSNIDYLIRIYGSGNALKHLEGDVMQLYSKIRSFPQGKETSHPTEKPIALISELLRLSSNEGDVVLDPFMGSGTTAVACIKDKRNFIGFELCKEYYDIACRRIEVEQMQMSLF